MRVGVLGVRTPAFCDDLGDFGFTFLHCEIVGLVDWAACNNAFGCIGADELGVDVWGKNRGCCEKSVTELEFLSGVLAYVW